MANFISIDTATKLCSVSVFKKEQLHSTKEIEKQNSHSSLITIFIKDALKEAALSIKDLDYVAISNGPGSYTGLRIGASAAKALAYSLNKPLISYCTLENMVLGLKTSIKNTDVYIAAIDARREEVYLTMYDTLHNNIVERKNFILEENMFEKHLLNKKIAICGDGAEKFKKYHNNMNIKVDQNIKSSSKHCKSLVLESIKNKQFENISKFEPEYIKHFYVVSRINS